MTEHDPLERYRDRFVGTDTDLVYFDGNSLGRPLKVTADRLRDFVLEEWGGRLIRGWDERWFDLPAHPGRPDRPDLPRCRARPGGRR